MIDLRKVLISLACCCVCLSVATSAMADFVGVVSENKTDADTADLCGEANGADVPFPLTVCNVSIQFDEDDDRLLSVAFSDLQVMGVPGARFYNHPLGADVPLDCVFLDPFPDFICDSFVAIGEKCAGFGTTFLDGDFVSSEFNEYGHIVGGWWNGSPDNGLGDAFNGINPDGKVLILQSAVAVGLSLEGSTTVFWHNIGDPQVFEELVEIICEATCPEDQPCDDGNACTENDMCGPDGCVEGTPIDCDDGNECTDDYCDPDSGCTFAPIDCDDDDPCTIDDCDSAVGCTHTPLDLPCDDGIACTVDTFDPASGCVSTPDDLACDDGDACTDDSCDPQSGCANNQVDCGDGDQCTTDSCDHKDGCSNIPYCVLDSDCDDGNLCTADTCEGTCCLNMPVACPPGGFCDPATGQCVAVPVGFLDIIPGKCPNRLQRNGLGFLKVSLVSAGEADGGPFNACDVDVSTIQLCRADGSAGCAQPQGNPAPRCRDRATPFLGELCGCHTRRKDGLDDLDMRFKVADVINNLGLADMPAGVSVELELTASTNDGQNVKAGDCVELGRDLGPNP